MNNQTRLAGLRPVLALAVIGTALLTVGCGGGGAASAEGVADAKANPVADTGTQDQGATQPPTDAAPEPAQPTSPEPVEQDGSESGPAAPADEPAAGEEPVTGEPLPPNPVEDPVVAEPEQPLPEPEPVYGTALVRWQAPTARTDGVALSMQQLQGYRIYWGTTQNPQAHVVEIDDPYLTEYALDGLVPDTYSFRVTAVDSDGRESDPSATLSKPIP